MARWFVHAGNGHFYVRNGDTGEIAQMYFTDIDEAFDHASVLSGHECSATMSEAGQGMAALTNGHPDVTIPNGVGSASDVSPGQPPYLARHAL